MHHFFEAITNTSGESLVGYFARVINPNTQATVTIAADNNGTPIATQSGVTNMAKTDPYGNLSLYVDPGTYHLDIYAPDANTFIYRVPNVAMNSTKGDKGDQGDAGLAGPSNNTRETLAALKAANISDKTSLYDGSLWTWTPGNYTGQADDLNIVKADSTALSVGAWVRQQATGVSAQAGWTIAPTRSQASKNDDIASAFDVIPRAQHAAIQARTSTYEPTADLIKAITDAAAQRRQLLLPPGLYNVRPETTFTSEAGACLTALPIPSYMDITGPGATLRVVNGVSTDASPKLMSLFGTNGTPHDVSWRDLVLDMNGTNNPMSPGRDTDTYNRFPQAGIYVSGTPGGVAARIDDALVQRCTFQNGPGVSCIVMTQSNSPSIVMGKRWKVYDCRFLENGYDTDDHSSIFAWADDVETRGCLFQNSQQIGDYGRGGLVGYEVHGSNHKFIGNTVRNYFQGMWIGENKNEDVHGTIIDGCLFDQIKGIGIATFGIDPGFGSYGHSISNTRIVFDSLLHPGYPLKQGVSITSLYPRRDVRVDNLTVESPVGNPVASTAIAVDAPIQPGIHDQLVFRNVRAIGTTFRHYLRTNATRGLGTVTLDGGEGINLTPAGAFTIAADISVNATGAQIDHLIIDRPVSIDYRIPSQCAYASFIEGALGRLTLRPGDYRGMTLGGHVEGVTTVAARGGMFSKTAAIDPPSIAAAASWTTTIAFPAVTFADSVSGGFSASLGGLTASWDVATAGSVSLTLFNPTASPVDLPSIAATITTRKPA